MLKYLSKKKNIWFGLDSVQKRDNQLICTNGSETASPSGKFWMPIPMAKFRADSNVAESVLPIAPKLTPTANPSGILCTVMAITCCNNGKMWRQNIFINEVNIKHFKSSGLNSGLNSKRRKSIVLIVLFWPELLLWHFKKWMDPIPGKWMTRFYSLIHYQ